MTTSNTPSNIVVTKKCTKCNDEVEHLYTIGAEKALVCLYCWHESQDWAAYKALGVKYPPDRKKKKSGVRVRASKSTPKTAES